MSSEPFERDTTPPKDTPKGASPVGAWIDRHLADYESPLNWGCTIAVALIAVFAALALGGVALVLVIKFGQVIGAW